MTKKIIQPQTEKDGKVMFYIREQPYIPGRSYQATAITEEAAKWILKGGWNAN